MTIFTRFFILIILFTIPSVAMHDTGGLTHDTPLGVQWIIKVLDDHTTPLDSSGNLSIKDAINPSKGVFENLERLSETVSFFKNGNLEPMMQIIINKNGNSPFLLNDNPTKKEIDQLLPHVWIVGMVSAAPCYLFLEKNKSVDKGGLIRQLVHGLINFYGNHHFYWQGHTRRTFMHSLIAALHVLEPWVGNVMDPKMALEIENAVAENVVFTYMHPLVGKSVNTSLFMNADDVRAIFKKVYAVYKNDRTYSFKMSQKWNDVLQKTAREPHGYKELQSILKRLFSSMLMVNDKGGDSLRFALGKSMAVVFKKVLERFEHDDPHGIEKYNAFYRVLYEFLGTHPYSVFQLLVGTKPYTQQHSGWKIHVAANPNNVIDVARLVVPYLFENNITSKVVNNSTQLQEWIMQKNSQCGKFITTYLYDYETAKKVATELDTLLLPLHAKYPMHADETPPADAAIGQSGFLFIRYGEYDQGENHAQGGVTMMASSDDRDNKKQYVWDQRDYPFPKDILNPNSGAEMKRRIVGNDSEPFPGLNMHWMTPSGAEDVTWKSLLQKYYP
ncbi:MAG: hypothetical protein K2X98_03175 [Alphaproteobacteria bacterium]|nr:hypothetical protein [Alphaproteobacteria bacterium]